MDKHQQGLQEFAKLLLHNADFSAALSLLDFFLTIEEKQNVATRYLLIKELLKAEKPQRQIAKELNVSIAKITRGSNELKRLDKQLLTRLRQELGLPS